MPTLKFMMDTGLYAAGIAPPIAPAPPPGNAGQPKSKLPQPGGKSTLSPGAQHVANHMSDPLGATKQGFTDLTNKKLQYDQARENMQRELAMPQAVINHVSQIHGIMPGQPAGQQPTPGMTGNQPQIDPATGLPMQGQPGQDPNNPGGNDNPDMDPMTGNPANMAQTPGQINQNRPSMAGHQPGVSPGPSENVRPGKMGMPQPGGLPQNNKQAAKPKGAGSLPGAKGPGDPKVANRTKKAQGNSSRQVKISVAASTSRNRTIETQFGLATLMAGGPGSGRRPEFHTIKNRDVLNNFHNTLVSRGYKFKYSVNDPTDSGVRRHVYRSGDASARIFEGANGNHGASDESGSLKAAGTSTGAKKHWSVRNKGPLSKKEKDAHFKTMDAMTLGMRPGSPGSGMRSPANIGSHVPSGGPAKPVMFSSKRMKAGPAQLEDKVSDSGAQLSYNPTGGTMAPKLNAGKHMKGCSCSKCKMNARKG